MTLNFSAKRAIPNSVLRFPSGQTVDQVHKDAKALCRLEPFLPYLQALDRVSKERHQSPDGYEAGLRLAREYAEYEAKREGRNYQYCAKCERRATVLVFGGFPYCGYHADVNIDEVDIPPYQGQIPEDAICFDTASNCMAPPTRIYGGVCFCEFHYRDAKSGGRRRRILFGE